MPDPEIAPYSYELPNDRIAMRPAYPYDDAKLLVVDRRSGELQEARFRDLPQFLPAQVHFTLNNTRVIPARLFGHLERTGAEVEILLLNARSTDVWECTGRPMKRFRDQEIITFSPRLVAQVIERIPPQRMVLRFVSPQAPATDSTALLWEHGVMPIPPYIRSGQADQQDRTDYQSLFAAIDGSVAAPTASLHFTPELVSSLTNRGASWSFVTLHVGAPSFTPVWSDEAGMQKIIPPGVERYQVSAAIVEELAAKRRAGIRSVAVGTTVIRALESAARRGKSETWSDTNLFIAPGFTFELVDAVITNFHQPRSTHLLLIEALLGKALLARCYEYALSHDFRFFSYGDGMLIL